jgi:putative ATP-dependent endonuclease of the OLD family
LLSGNGNEGALNLVRFLKDHGRRLAFVLVDADSAEGKPFSKNKLRQVGIRNGDIYYVGDRELEDLFTDAQWQAVANREWPRNDGREWTEEDFARLRTGEKFSKAIENAVRPVAPTAPQGKPGYLLALVQGLKDPSELPGSLLAVFEKLIALAAA